MKKMVLVLAALGVMGFAQARNTTLYLDINTAMRSAEARNALLPNVKVSFQAGGPVIKSGLTSRRKTNAFGKSDEDACRWAFLSAVKAFQSTAVASGGSRVVNLHSYYNKKSAPVGKYECHAGAIMAGVVLRGDIAR